MTEAIVLVGGQGSRLRPLTIHTAKPLLPTANRPFLVHALARLRAAGITHVLLATSYRAETFREELGEGEGLGLTLEYVVETEALGTGGAIRNAGRRLQGGPDDAVVILNGDILSGADLGAQLAWHARTESDITLHLTEVDDARAFGSVPTDDTGRVTAFLEKMAEPPTNRINAGCYIFKRKLVDGIPDGRVVSVERETFPDLLAGGAHVSGFLDDTYWLDVGTPQAYVRASRDLVLGRAPSPAVPAPAPFLLDDGAVVDPAAVIDGGSAIGPKTRIGEGATVTGSIVLEGAVIEAGAVVADSVVGRSASVGERSLLTGVVVGDGARIGADNELGFGARVWADASLAEKSVRLSSDC